MGVAKRVRQREIRAKHTGHARFSRGTGIIGHEADRVGPERSSVNALTHDQERRTYKKGSY